MADHTTYTPLSSSVNVTDDMEMNTIDFTKFNGAYTKSSFNAISIPSQVVEPPSGVPKNRWGSRTHPVIFVVSAEPSCATSGRFFCTRLVHYLSWIGECAKKFEVVQPFCAPPPPPAGSTCEEGGGTQRKDSEGSAPCCGTQHSCDGNGRLSTSSDDNNNWRYGNADDTSEANRARKHLPDTFTESCALTNTGAPSSVLSSTLPTILLGATVPTQNCSGSADLACDIECHGLKVDGSERVAAESGVQGKGSRQATEAGASTDDKDANPFVGCNEEVPQVSITVESGSSSESEPRGRPAGVASRGDFLSSPSSPFSLGDDLERRNSHSLVRFHSENEKWRESMKASIKDIQEFLMTDMQVGYTQSQIAVLFVDSETAAAAREIGEEIKAHDRHTLTRYIFFGEGWHDDVSHIERYIDVNLMEGSIRTTRCKGSIVCSLVMLYLNTCLDVLQRVFLYESGEGSEYESLSSFAPIFFTRHGQSEYNLEDRLGGDPDLTENGLDDADTIGKFFETQVAGNPLLFSGRNEEWDTKEGFDVWCSQLRRTRRTAAPAARVLTGGRIATLKSLNEIHAGICEDMTNEEVKVHFPSIQEFRESNKVAYRYPNGESYLDLMRRLQPLLCEMLTTRKCILVVAHQAVLRTILSYFGGASIVQAVQTPCPHRTVWCCTYNRLGEPRLTTITLPKRTVKPSIPPLSSAQPQKNTENVPDLSSPAEQPDVKWTGW